MSGSHNATPGREPSYLEEINFSDLFAVLTQQRDCLLGVGNKEGPLLEEPLAQDF